MKIPVLALTKFSRFAIKNTVEILAAGTAALLLVSCSSRMPQHAPSPMPAPAPVPADAPVFTPQPAAPPAPPVAAADRLPLVANWADYRRRAAQVILAVNPGASFTGPQPAQWSGIATVTIMLNADGSIRALDLMRGSRISPHVNDLALAAVRKSMNYGSVTNLPQPWQFNETFLYNDKDKFQLVTVVEGR